MVLKARNDIHMARRLWHFAGVMTVFALYVSLPRQAAKITAVTISGSLILLDLCRLYWPRLNDALTKVFQPFLRESERGRLAGSTYMLAGVTLIILLYSRNVVQLTLLLFAFADPLASYCGIRWGREKLIGDKTVQGSLSAFAACFIIAVAYFYAQDLMRERLFIVALLSGLIGAFSELVPLGRLDDNFVFPVLSATLLTALFYIFGGL